MTEETDKCEANILEDTNTSYVMVWHDIGQILEHTEKVPF